MLYCRLLIKQSVSISLSGKPLLMVMVAILLFSCQPETKQDGDTITKGNVATTLSTDSAKLAKLIDLTRWRPTQVRFKYTLIDNSGKHDRMSIPGPSDSHLEAVLYFDSITFNKLRKMYFLVDYKDPDYDKQQFNFTWLDPAIKTELLAGDASYHGHPDVFFGLGPTGKIWFLTNKCLVVK
jgi:hypothetical protein